MPHGREHVTFTLRNPAEVLRKHLSFQVIGEVTELFVDNIDQHPYHHHVQPYQIVAMDNDTDDMNAWWRVSRLLPSCQMIIT